MPSTSSNKAQGCLPPRPGYLSLENATYLVQSFKPFDDKQQHTLYTWGGAGGGERRAESSAERARQGRKITLIKAISITQ